MDFKIDNGLGCAKIPCTRIGMHFTYEKEMIIKLWHIELVKFIRPIITNGIIKKGSLVYDYRLLQSFPYLPKDQIV